MNDQEAAAPSRSVSGGQHLLWRWFRLAGVPVIALTIIAGAIIWLRAPSAPAGAVRLDTTGDDVGAAPEPGSRAPDFTLTATDGTVYHLDDLRGHPVMINFWATWCGPCRGEMPDIDAEYQARKADGLIVLAVNVREGPNLVGGFIKNLGVSFPVLLDPSGGVSSRYHVHALPTTVLIRPDGIIDGIRIGPYTRHMLSGRLEQLLGQ